MESAAKKYLDTNREKLGAFASSQMFFSWADAAIEQGADVDNIMFQVMSYNIEGGIMENIKVDTWLPVFSGFYGTIWETDGDEENEIGYINEQRKEKGLDSIEWEAVNWNYEGYRQDVVKQVSVYIGNELEKAGFISALKFQELRSPREYNFANDSVNIEIELSKKNTVKILSYLSEHKKEFSEYISERYTSRSGFISSYSNDAETWLNGESVAHGHKLGSILQFILWNENGEGYEMEIYERLSGNGCRLYAANFAELIKETI